MHVNGAVALVTGANRGIGRAIVEALLARGAATVYAAARRLESVEDLAARDGRSAPPAGRDQFRADRPGGPAGADATLLVNNGGSLRFASLASVAGAILDGVEAGDENIFPDAIAQGG